MHSQNKYYFLNIFICSRHTRLINGIKWRWKSSRKSQKKEGLHKDEDNAEGEGEEQDTKAKLVAIKNALSFVRFYCFLFEEYGD